MSIHHFDVKDAENYGVECAVILKHIKFWLEKNIANNVHIHEGRVWTYNSAEAFSKQFPYLSAKQIYRRLKKLEDDGILIKGNFNEKSYDKTTWYSLDLPLYLISRNREMEFPKSGNGIPEIGEPIPDSDTDNKPYPKKKKYKKEKPEIVILKNGAEIIIENEKEKSSDKKKKFQKPTIQEIGEYCEERQNGIDPEKFFNYYESKGWKVGKSPMKNWKAAIRTWESNSNNYDNKAKEPTVGRQTYSDIQANSDWSKI